MKTEEYINNVVDFLQQTEQDSYNIICDKDLRLKFIGRNLQEIATLSDDDINKNLKETKSVLTKVSDEYRIESKKILDKEVNESHFLTLLSKENQTQVLQTIIRSISQNNNTIGVYGKSNHALAINTHIFSHPEIQNILDGTPIVIKANEFRKNNLPNISEKNLIILFLMVMGKVDKQIADFISVLYDTEITASGITKIINRSLFNTFNVNSRSSLITKAHSMGVLNVIPTILFKNISSLL